MSALIDALRRKFKTPKDALCALGLDAALLNEENNMSKTKLTPMAFMAAGAIDNYLRPRLATDASVAVLPLLSGLTVKNFAEKIPGIASGIKIAAKGKLAQDADVEDVTDVLEALTDMAPEIAAATEAETDNPDDMEEDDEPPEMMAKVREFLKDHLDPEDMAKFDEMVGGTPEIKEPEAVDEEKKWAMDFKKRMGRDESEEERAERMKKMDAEKPVSKGAMDAAIAAAVKATEVATTNRQVAIRDAEKAVRPYVGELSIACDSADAVFRTALEMLGVPKVKDIHPSAYPTILGMQKKRGAKADPVLGIRLATDAASKTLTNFLPGVGSIQRM